MLAPIAGMDVDRTMVTFAFARPDGTVPRCSRRSRRRSSTACRDAASRSAAAPHPRMRSRAPGGALQRSGTRHCRLLVRRRIPRHLRHSGCSGADRSPTLPRFARIASFGPAARSLSLRCRTCCGRYQLRANGSQPIAPAPLFGGAAALVPIFRDALQSPDHAALTPAAAPSFSSEALVPTPLNANEESHSSRAATASTRRCCARSSFRRCCPQMRFSASPWRSRCMRSARRSASRDRALAKLLPRDFAGLSSAAAWLLGVLQKKYPDQVARDKNILPHTQALNELRRDALCDVHHRAGRSARVPQPRRSLRLLSDRRGHGRLLRDLASGGGALQPAALRLPLSDRPRAVEVRRPRRSCR